MLFRCSQCDLVFEDKDLCPECGSHDFNYANNNDNEESQDEVSDSWDDESEFDIEDNEEEEIEDNFED